MALHLAFRLKRLEAMRDAVARLFTRKQLGVDIFSRGMPEGIRTTRKSDYWASVYDLLKAYAEQRRRTAMVAPVKMGGRKVWSIREARERLERLFGIPGNWSVLESYIEDYLRDAEISKTALAILLRRDARIDARRVHRASPGAGICADLCSLAKGKALPRPCRRSYISQLTCVRFSFARESRVRPVVAAHKES